MADCLANLKERLHLNHVAYASPTGLVDSNSIRVGVSDIFVAKYKSTDQETLTRFQSSIDQLITLAAEYHGRDQDWHTRDEWVEACCWFLLKRPRVFKAKWSGWFGSAFDVMDEDHDGYISEDEISFFYQLTCRANDKAWISRAFKSMDLDNSGKISREKYFPELKAMPDAPGALKDRCRLNYVAYAIPTCVIDANAARIRFLDIFRAKYKSTSQERLTRLQSSVDQAVTLVVECHGRNQGWHTHDEWVEACCWFLLMRPRVFKAKESAWFGSAFDVMDEDHDGYISEAEISFRP